MFEKQGVLKRWKLRGRWQEAWGVQCVWKVLEGFWILRIVLC